MYRGKLCLYCDGETYTIKDYRSHHQRQFYSNMIYLSIKRHGWFKQKPKCKNGSLLHKNTGTDRVVKPMTVSWRYR